MSNLIHTLKQGEVGKTITFTLEDVDGAVNLTNYTVTMTLTLNGVVVVDNAAVTKRTQAGATLGQCYHTWTSTTANIPVSEPISYKGELKLVNGPDTLYWPVDADGEQAYFAVIVQPSLS